MRTKVLGGFAIPLAALTVMSCGQFKKKETVVEEGPKTVLVTTHVAEMANVEQIAEFTATIDPFQQNNIAPAVPGRIDRIPVDVGAKVSKGTLLAVMDRTQYSQLAAQLANLEADNARLKAVYNAGGISRSQMDQSDTQLSVQREALRNLRENIELRSPINGVVTARNYDAGDLYTGMPILTVMQMNPLKVKADISETYFPQVKTGQSVDINVDMFPDKKFSGKVSLIYPAIKAQTRTFTVEITIPNNDLTLRPGMFARTTLKFGSRPGVMIEDLAIQKQFGTNEKYVYVAGDGEAVRRVVTVGRRIGSQVNILSGVESGEEVITSGFTKLSDGTAITVSKR